MAKARRVAKRKAAPAPRPTKKIQPVPPGYHTVTAYLTVNDGARALDFYQRAFGARDIERMPGPGGKLMHAEFKIGDSIVMLSDEFPGMSSCKAPTSLGGTTVTMFLYVPNVDVVFKRALEVTSSARWWSFLFEQDVRAGLLDGVRHLASILRSSTIIYLPDSAYPPSEASDRLHDGDGVAEVIRWLETNVGAAASSIDAIRGADEDHWDESGYVIERLEAAV